MHKSIEDREFNKFRDTPNGEAVAVVIESSETENIKNQILESQDREQYLTYADFGTKNQRIVKMEYLSPSIANKIARKTFSYTMDGNSYRMTSIVWEIITV